MPITPEQISEIMREYGKRGGKAGTGKCKVRLGRDFILFAKQGRAARQRKEAERNGYRSIDEILPPSLYLTKPENNNSSQVEVWE